MDKDIQKINNLYISKKINGKKYKLQRKNKILRIIAGVSILAVLTTSVYGFNKFKKNQVIQTENAIVQYYSEDSVEKNIYDYIMISEKLHNLNLGDFEISDELLKECNIEDGLLNPSDINSLIDEFKNEGLYIPNKSIDRDYNRVVLISKLIYQEKLVNKYIYDKGYDFAHNNITSAAKKYAGEAYGVEPSSIKFSYRAPKDDDIARVNINIVNGDDNIIYSQSVSGWGDKEIKEDIKEAVSYMDMTDKRFDDEENDNNLYNRGRNIRIINALKLSAELFSKVNNNDLYSENLNKNLIGKSK